VRLREKKVVSLSDVRGPMSMRNGWRKDSSTMGDSLNTGGKSETRMGLLLETRLKDIGCLRRGTSEKKERKAIATIGCFKG